MKEMISGLCYVFGIIDIVSAYVFDCDLTGVSWSPIVAFALGGLLSSSEEELPSPNKSINHE